MIFKVFSISCDVKQSVESAIRPADAIPDKPPAALDFGVFDAVAYIRQILKSTPIHQFSPAGYDGCFLDGIGVDDKSHVLSQMARYLFLQVIRGHHDHVETIQFGTELKMFLRLAFVGFILPEIDIIAQVDDQLGSVSIFQSKRVIQRRRLGSLGQDQNGRLQKTPDEWSTFAVYPGLHTHLCQYFANLRAANAIACYRMISCIWPELDFHYSTIRGQRDAVQV